jgi:hypothetical protein
MAYKLLRKHVLKRGGQEDILFGFISRNASASVSRSTGYDAIYQWVDGQWALVYELPGTNLIYDTVTWRDRMYFVDGRNGLKVYDGHGICPVTQAPVFQYIIAFQDRLVGAGDSRTEAEVVEDSGVWPVDSNRDRARFCEVLDDATWSPNNFIDCRTGTGEVVSGLGTNSITTSNMGAQTQLVIFKPTAYLINQGTLGSLDQTLSVGSTVLGCPGYQTIVNTSFGLMFTSRKTVCLLDTSSKEPQQVGFVIWPEIDGISETEDNVYTSMKAKSAAIFHDNTYKLSIARDGAAYNDTEWWLDMRPEVFPQDANWYGPHNGDRILQYVIYSGDLVGGQMNTTKVWLLDQENVWNGMLGTNLNCLAITNRVEVANEQLGKLDAYGLTLAAAPNNGVLVKASLDDDLKKLTNTWTAPATQPGFHSVVRPVRYPAHNVQLEIYNTAPGEVLIDSIYFRSKERRKQSVRQTGSTQS